MKYELPSSTMSSTMGCHIERLENVCSQISAGAQWHPLSRFFEQPTGRLQYSLYCIRAFPTEQCNMNYSNCILLAPTVIYNLVPLRVQRLRPSGGRGRLLHEEQELAIVNMVIANSEIKLKEIRANILQDNLVFENIRAISLTSISRTLAKHRVLMKQLYKVPFERNSVRIKELRHQYVQRVMELETNQVPHNIIYIDEAGFNLAKKRRRGRNIIGKRATVAVPGQRGANITMCAAISNNGVLLHKSQIGPYHTERLLQFLEELYDRLVPEGERGQGELGGNLLTYVITWDNVAFHHAHAVTAWFDAHPRMMSLFLAPYSPFLNPIEEFFSAWRWKVFDHHPHDQMSLLDAMAAACQDITADNCQGWIRHAKRYFPRCLAREDIRCDVDENMWPNADESESESESPLLSLLLLYIVQRNLSAAPLVQTTEQISFFFFLFYSDFFCSFFFLCI
ncbi:uncharacterized protein [Trachinotus anak]|uniref:uncharacterized protein n=1 Tax=Trachinotus anak TaxID=443729 RepID=UPI0039F236C2